MLTEILKRTPPWVFVLFLALLALGYVQSKGRTLSRGRAAILPVVMLVLSFLGVLSAFGAAPAGFAFWSLGVAIAVLLGVKLAFPKGVTFSTETQTFFVPGSWFPLYLMMTLFFTKYAVGVVLARQLPMASEPLFLGIVSFCYGLLSGVFLARATVMWRAANR